MVKTAQIRRKEVYMRNEGDFDERGSSGVTDSPYRKTSIQCESVTVAQEFEL